MANYFKNCLNLHKQFYGCRKLLSTLASEPPKMNISEKDYESLWNKSQHSLGDQKSILNFEEFKFVIDNVKNLIDEWKNTGAISKNKPISNFVKTVFQNSDPSISKKFLENFSNWSVLYENIGELSLIGYNTTIVKSKINQNLNETIDLILLDVINRIVNDMEFLEEDIRKLSKSNLSLDQSKFSLDLGLSLYNYLKKMNKISSQNEEIITMLLIKASLNYIQTYFYTNNFSIKYITENSNKMDKNILDCMSKTEQKIEKLMKIYKNFDSISDLKKNDYFRFFCFYESKWLNAVKWLLKSNQDELTLHHFALFALALRGSIRFERSDYFEKLFSILKKLCVFSNSKDLNYYDLIFRDYMNTYITITKLEDRLKVLLAVWSDISYVPNFIGRENLEFFVENVNNQLKNAWYDIVAVKVNTKGRVFNSEDTLEKAEFKYDDLKEISQMFKNQILSQEYLKKEKYKELSKIDKLIMSNNFDYIMDGMNIAMVRYKSIHFDNIKHAIKIINKSLREKNILIFVRDHLYNRNKAQIEKMMEKNHMENSSRNKIYFYCLDSIFEDDKFFLYAAFKSQNAMLISNDYFSNHSHFLKEYGVVFREWLFNKKLIFEAHLNRFLFPPEYKLKINKIGEDKWIVPFVKDTNNNRKHGFLKIEKKYFRNKN